MAPAYKTNETTITNIYTLIQLQFNTNDETPSIAPGFQKLLFFKRSNCLIHSSVRYVIVLRECKVDVQFFPFTVLRSQWREHWV